MLTTMRVRRLSSSWQMAQIGSSAAQIGSGLALASGAAIVSIEARIGKKNSRAYCRASSVRPHG
jgi:hypothetical protein